VIDENDQQDVTALYNLLFLGFSTCFERYFAHHQEHLNCITASGITHVCRCRLVSWECWTPFQHSHDTSCVCMCVGLRSNTPMLPSVCMCVGTPFQHSHVTSCVCMCVGTPFQHSHVTSYVYVCLCARAHTYTHIHKYCNKQQLNIACFLLGNSSASEFYMPTFRNTLFHLHRRIGMKNE
jgi:hypothetical protein